MRSRGKKGRKQKGIEERREKKGRMNEKKERDTEMQRG